MCYVRNHSDTIFLLFNNISKKKKLFFLFHYFIFSVKFHFPPILASIIIFRSYLISTMLEFRLVQLRGTTWHITKHFSLYKFDIIHQTSSKSKFKDWPKIRLNKLNSMFSFCILKTITFSFKNWSLWQRLDEILN